MKTKWNWIVILAMLFGLVFTGPKQTALAATANLTIEPSALPDAMITVNFQLLLIARYAGGGECSNCTWYTTSGELPEGVHINGDTGELLGVPQAVGTYTFTVVADDGTDMPGSQAYSWNVTKVKTIVDVGLDSTTYVGNTVPTSLGAAASHPNPYYSPQPTGKMSFSVDGVPVPGCSGADAVSTNSWGQAYCTSYVPPAGLTAGAYDIQAEFTPDATSAGLYLSASGTGTLAVKPPHAIVSGLVFFDDDQDGVRDEGEAAQGAWNVYLNQDCDTFLEGNVVTYELTGEFTYYPVPIEGHTYCLYVDLSGYSGYVQTTPYNNLTLSGDQYFEIGVFYPHISILPNAEELPVGSVGTYYEQTIAVSGGTKPYTVKVTGIPDGLSFDTDTFILSGTPAVAGLVELGLIVTDSEGLSAEKTYRMVIKGEGVFDLASSANPSAPGQEVTFTVEASGIADTPYGTLPPVGIVTFLDDGNPIDDCSMLYLNVMPDENGEPIFGNFPATCTTATLETGSHEITAEYMDGFGVYNDATLALTQVVGVVPSLIISPETLPNAEYQTPYSQQFTAAGGTEPYTFSLTGGALPSGISLNAGGLLSGFADLPAAPGSYPITIQVEDANGVTAGRAFDFGLDKGVPTVVAHTPDNIYWNNPFNLWAEVTKKISDSQYAVLDGTVAFSIDGTPVPGCDAVTEENGYYLCSSVSIDLAVGPHTVSAAYAPTGWYAGYYTPGSDSSEFEVQPRVYTIQGYIFKDADQDGAWDEGADPRLYENGWTVNLDQGCDGSVDYTTTTTWGGFAFSSIPTSGQCHRITMIAAPGYQQTTQLADFVPDASTFISIGFYYPTIIISPSAYDLPSVTIGVEYSQAFSASGGTEPYAYTISFGSLPEGLTLSTAGTLSGTPTQAGYYNFTVQAEDANHAAGWRGYTLSIERVKVDGNFNFTSSLNPSAPNEAVTFSVSATGDVETPDGVFPPIGLVTFFAGGTAIGGCSNLYLNIVLDQEGNPTIGDYPASCTTAALELGSHEITAIYYDMLDAYNVPSLALTQVVEAPKVTPTLSTGISTPTYYGHLFNLSALARATYTDVLGKVDFAIDGDPVEKCQGVTQDENGQYLCVEIDLTLAVGSHTLTASFTPDDAGTYNSVSGSRPFTVLSGSYQIQGYVFEDQDKDGEWGSTEYGSYGWTINLTTCAGDPVIDTNGSVIRTQVSSYGGYFLFQYIPGGQCVRLSEEVQPGWQPTTPTYVDYTLSADIYPLYFGSYYPRITISTTGDLLPGSVGAAYGPVAFSATGGEGPYTYSLKDGYGALPAGLQLSADGVLSGTPTLAGSYSFAVQAEDKNQAAGYQYYSITVMTDATFDLSSSSNPSSPGEAVTFTFSASGEALDPYNGGTQPPHGQVTFQADGVNIEGCIDMALNYDLANYTYGDFPAACTTSALGAGAHEIQALYKDDAGCFYDATLTLTQVVQAQTVSADLAITMLDKPDPVKPGAKLVYTLTVTNLGPNTAESVIVTDKLDVNTAYVSVSAPAGWICKYKKGTLTCTTSGLDSGATATINITVKVSKTAKVGKDLVNNAFVSSLTDDLDLTNNSVVEKTLVKK